MDVKFVDIIKDGTLLCPPSNACQFCAVVHLPERPHNNESLFYKTRFCKAHGRWPTWADAVAHCPSITRDAARELLVEYGAWSETTSPIAERDNGQNQIFAKRDCLCVAPDIEDCQVSYM